jgi:hypothetical protein
MARKVKQLPSKAEVAADLTDVRLKNRDRQLTFNSILTYIHGELQSIACYTDTPAYFMIRRMAALINTYFDKQTIKVRIKIHPWDLDEERREKFRGRQYFSNHKQGDVISVLPIVFPLIQDGKRIVHRSYISFNKINGCFLEWPKECLAKVGDESCHADRKRAVKKAVRRSRKAR